MSDRGEYRPFFGSMLDDPDFQAMPGDTFKVLFALKHMLGPAGIGIPRKAEIAEVCGKSMAEVEDALDELEQPKPDEEYGWILRERNIVWLVNGLRHELLKPNNYPHREGVARQLRAVGDKSIVAKFRAYYPEWFGRHAPPEGATREPDGDPKGTQEGVKRHKTKRNETRLETRQDKSETSARRFLEAFYADASADRRSAVEAQLDAALSPEGARVRKGETVRARSLAHLERCLDDTIRQGVRDPDKAIVVALKKLTDPELDSRGQTVTEAASNQFKRDDKLFDLYLAEKTNAGRAWALANSDEWGEIETTVDKRLGMSSDAPMYQTIRKTQLADAAGDAAGFPAYEEWLSTREVTAA